MLPLPAIGHNDFISQGVFKRYLKSRMEKTADKSTELQTANDQYHLVCTYILLFLDSKLKDLSHDWDELQLNRGLKMGYTIFMEKAEKGSTAPLILNESAGANAKRVKTYAF